MNVRCDRCATVYRVDPAKVPPDGIRARCARCAAVFRVERASPRTAAVPLPRQGNDLAAVAPSSPESSAIRVEVERVETTPLDPAGNETGPVGTDSPLGDSATEGPEGRSATDSAGATPLDGGGIDPRAAGMDSSHEVSTVGRPDEGPRSGFGSVDPHERARRLARALVSDIVAYNGSLRDRALATGTVRQDLGPEIRKSWETYSMQVGNQIARETSYFRDALNEILARGQRLF